MNKIITISREFGSGGRELCINTSNAVIKDISSPIAELLKAMLYKKTEDK